MTADQVCAESIGNLAITIANSRISSHFRSDSCITGIDQHPRRTPPHSGGEVGKSIIEK